MLKDVTWIRFYSIIVAHCDNLDDALDEFRDYADVLLFTRSERKAFIQLLQSNRNATHAVIMAEVYRVFASRMSRPDQDVIHAIGESLCAHDCIVNSNKLRDFRRILGLDDHTSLSSSQSRHVSSGCPPVNANDMLKAAGYPLFEHVTVKVLPAESANQPQQKIVTGAVDHNTQYKFGAATASTQRKFGATKPSASRSNRT